MGFPVVQTDRGTTAIVYTTSAGGQYPIHGAYDAGEHGWIPVAWAIDGAHFIGRSHGLDITKAINEGQIKGAGAQAA